MGRKMRQFIKAEQRNLRPLPLINRGFELQVGGLDLAAALSINDRTLPPESA